MQFLDFTIKELGHPPDLIIGGQGTTVLSVGGIGGLLEYLNIFCLPTLSLFFHRFSGGQPGPNFINPFYHAQLRLCSNFNFEHN